MKSLLAATLGILPFAHAAQPADPPADPPGVFAPDSQWETLSDGYQILEGIAASQEGTVFITDVPAGQLFRIAPDGPRTLVDQDTQRANGLAFGPDGRLYGACMAKPALVHWDTRTGTKAEIPLPTPANDLAITPAGALYYTWGAANAIYHLAIADPKPTKVADLPNPNGITLSHDRKELWVGEFYGDTVRAFPILPDGTLGPPRPAFKARIPPNGKGLLDGMTPLADGRLLAATALGLQILTADKEPLLIPNPTPRRANYVRIVTTPDGKRWIYAAHEKSLLRRQTLL
jgi:sugar lactone lactonase YvrE